MDAAAPPLAAAAPACQDRAAAMELVRRLYQQHAAELLRFARSLLGDPAQAEDAVAEAFARVLAGPPLPAEVSGRAWLFGVVRNVCRQARRRGAAAAPAPEPAAGGDLEAEAQARAELARTLADLGRLPEEAREALLLRAQEGLSYDEVAEALGTTPGAAKVRVHRARAELARLRAGREVPPWK